MSRTLLVVEDNPDLRDLLVAFLGLHGFVVLTAADGEAALLVIRERLPDLIITDIEMPRLDGIGLIRELRRHPDTRDLPILVLTAYLAKGLTEAMAAGATQAAYKPVQLDALIRMIEQLL